MYFKRFLATNQKYIAVNTYSTQWIYIWVYRKYFWTPISPHNAKLTFDNLLWTWGAESQTYTQLRKKTIRCMLYFTCSHEHKIYLLFTRLNNENTIIFGMASTQNSRSSLNKHSLKQIIYFHVNRYIIWICQRFVKHNQLLRFRFTWRHLINLKM